jgi:hypothetical protein
VGDCVCGYWQVRQLSDSRQYRSGKGTSHKEVKELLVTEEALVQCESRVAVAVGDFWESRKANVRRWKQVPGDWWRDNIELQRVWNSDNAELWIVIKNYECPVNQVSNSNPTSLLRHTSHTHDNVLRTITSSPWYVSNFTLHNDLKIPFITDKIDTQPCTITG